MERYFNVSSKDDDQTFDPIWKKAGWCVQAFGIPRQSPQKAKWAPRFHIIGNIQNEKGRFEYLQSDE